MKKIFLYNIYFFFILLCLTLRPIHTTEININNVAEFNLSLKNAKKDDILKLGPGVYNGNFIIDHSISIIGHGFVILTSNNNGTILTVNAPHVKITGIHFYNSGKSMFEKDSCIFIKESNVTLYNNFFSECGFSIWIDSGFYNYIINNIFIGTVKNTLSDRGNSIQIYKSSNTIVANNFIINGRDGIYISNSNEVSINKNSFTNLRFGIHYMFSNKSNVFSNMVIDSLIGIAIMYSKYVDLINNFIYLNVDHGLFFRDVLYSRILKNKSLYNTDGILLGSSYFNDVINNDIIKNHIGIKIYSGSDENLVYDNNIISNRLQVQFLDNKKLVWNSRTSGNFWSHYIGWDLNMDNIGDKIFYVTNINDWLIFSYPILRVMFNSPALILLQKIENQFPTFRKYSIVDNYPLMRPVIW
ncbi:MAG: nitrous oxide reductase family maturation protein NosD [Candidatus Riesia sp.]|nr:nitrous oxide reductase family maturation protein NosD [Candidatus Riesia sp.]